MMVNVYYQTVPEDTTSVYDLKKFSFLFTFKRNHKLFNQQCYN